MINKILDFHPSKKYPGMTVQDYLNNFFDTITLGPQRFSLRMWWCKKFGKKKPAYSFCFGKFGVVLENGWFVPNDGAFSYGYDPNPQFY